MTNFDDELIQEFTKLLEVQTKASMAAHDFAKSFAIHPKGCVYCAEGANQ